MDANQFDSLTRSLSTVGSRRLTFGALLGGALGVLGLAGAEARKSKCKPVCTECTTCKKGKCRKKNGKKKCKKGTCQPKSNGTVCNLPAGGATCQNGTCTCPNGLPNCNGSCVNTSTDEAHCGSCGAACAAGQTCCNGSCTDLQTDAANCSACGTACPVGHACCSGVCKDVRTDEANCGACGTVCTATQVCQQGGQGAACFPIGACPANTTGLCSGPLLVRACSPQGTGCFCERSTEGNVVCASHINATCTARLCTTSADCAAGSACVALSGPGCSNCPVGTKACLEKCPNPTVP